MATLSNYIILPRFYILGLTDLICDLWNNRLQGKVEFSFDFDICFVNKIDDEYRTKYPNLSLVLEFNKLENIKVRIQDKYNELPSSGYIVFDDCTSQLLETQISSLNSLCYVITIRSNTNRCAVDLYELRKYKDGKYGFFMIFLGEQSQLNSVNYDFVIINKDRNKHPVEVGFRDPI